MLVRDIETVGTSRTDEGASLSSYIAFVLGMRPGSLLDVGFGHGELLRAAHDLGIPSYGIDVNDASRPLLENTDVKVFVANAESPGGPSDSFDFVTVRHTLHHLRNPGKCLQELARLARSLVIASEIQWDLSTPENELASLIDHWHKKVDRHNGMYHRNPITVDEMTRLGHRAGLRPIIRLRFIDPQNASQETVASAIASRLRTADIHKDLHIEGLKLLERIRRQKVANRISETVVFRKIDHERR